MPNCDCCVVGLTNTLKSIDISVIIDQQWEKPGTQNGLWLMIPWVPCGFVCAVCVHEMLPVESLQKMSMGKQQAVAATLITVRSWNIIHTHRAHLWLIWRKKRQEIRTYFWNINACVLSVCHTVNQPILISSFPQSLRQGEHGYAEMWFDSLIFTIHLAKDCFRLLIKEQTTHTHTVYSNNSPFATLKNLNRFLYSSFYFSTFFVGSSLLCFQWRRGWDQKLLLQQTGKV